VKTEIAVVHLKYFTALSPKVQQIIEYVFADGLDLVGAVQKADPSMGLDQAKLVARRLLLENAAFQNVVADAVFGFDLAATRDTPAFPGSIR
jgi:hypothetical protein